METCIERRVRVQFESNNSWDSQGSTHLPLTTSVSHRGETERGRRSILGVTPHCAVSRLTGGRGVNDDQILITTGIEVRLTISLDQRVQITPTQTYAYDFCLKLRREFITCIA